MFGDCSANIPRLLVADHPRIFAEHFSRQNIANGSRKISMQALKILGIGKCAPTSCHEFRLFAEGSVIPPEHRLMLVNFHRECIGDAKKAQWDRGINCMQNKDDKKSHWPLFKDSISLLLPRLSKLPAYPIQMGQATWAIWAASKKYSRRINSGTAVYTLYLFWLYTEQSQQSEQSFAAFPTAIYVTVRHVISHLVKCLKI